ncbi:MAG: hypothetical protein HQ556_00165 [Candidatus Marinimicrobia bacterium]|nr:hypothetical protein [Candidatus Neomarinimicrobiota bacterium]
MRKAIFPLLFLFLSFGDWHLHAESTHPCDTAHTAVDSDMKWHPHGTCEETETNVSHDDLSGLLLASKYDQLNACEAVNPIHSSPNDLIHLENGHDCHTPLLIHNQLCLSTVLLI